MIEEELPSPEELMPLSQTLITPRLALAFDIPSPNHRPRQHQPPPPYAQPIPADLGDLVSGAGGDEPPRTLKRPRLVWTPQLHKRFVDAVAHLGINNAVPKTIMQLMSVDGLTRENVASHLQKYRLYLKRMQGLSGGNGGATADPTTDHLFASSPVPPHFLHPVPGPQQQHHHHQQQRIAAAVGHPQLVAQYHRQMGQFGSSPNGQFEHPYLGKQPPIHNQAPSSNGNGGIKALTLFPTGE
ncbi:hypothetical protein like AT3G10760 [Hibiscus trionum]|uniref:HTH myb-type domain-containing protein n=1 Tax=Hibiscus trionum TaxID=183268 RepID=A0A9W7LYI2_HIBTR|nr:hypothetical protein like AT3G10760 [Hibiscus trionum]